MTTKKTEFSVRVSRELARSILHNPPEKPATRRPPDFRAGVMLEFYLPASICLEANKTIRPQYAKWMHSKNKHELLSFIAPQALKESLNVAVPLDRYYRSVRLNAIKFSARAPDYGANFAKKAIDLLTCNTKRTTDRLGLITDDNPSIVDQQHWWEFLPAKYTAFVLIELMAI
jgi:hypothetical protein